MQLAQRLLLEQATDLGFLALADGLCAIKIGLCYYDHVIDHPKIIYYPILMYSDLLQYIPKRTKI